MPATKQLSEYNREQLDTLLMVRRRLAVLGQEPQRALQEKIADYLQFRSDVDGFLHEHFTALCNRTCYTSRRSACCSREGIITFFADVVINCLQSTGDDLDKLQRDLLGIQNEHKCVYLTARGCHWRVRPIVCAMFLCNRAAKTVFEDRPSLRNRWEELCRRKQLFTWPDRPVLFDFLEAFFIDLGCSSPLMYLHNSPGLLRVKRRGQASTRDNP
ncbi:MAG: hypothetical protein AMJ54_09435 [Deltaproteobacteria bacterium SG8_13]|nr:MAG: hypothetical protein AMJ54_09435 [Deltaproteobacteria bacterium SG8_13]